MNGHYNNVANGTPLDSGDVEVLPQGTVLIAGGGPVGLTLATTLAHYGIRSVVLERNETTTKWPKMDLTNVRSMEIFRKLGLADDLRKQGVPSHLPQPVLMSTGLGAPKPITEWQHPGVDKFRVQIASVNDGTMPIEPWQRLSQAVFERWLKEICEKNPLIDLRFGCKVDDVEDLNNGVRVFTSKPLTGERHQLVSHYLVGCDGGSSKVRRSLKIPLDGGPMPVYVLLVHFKSRDLSRLHAHGQFWHIFFIGEAGLSSTCIAQNEKDIWTTHLLLPMDVDSDSIPSEDAVYRALGGIYEPYKIDIDEILVRSTYRPNIAISRAYSGAGGHVYLAGDAAHQNIPTGGYGMNMGIADAFELGWKMASVLNGYASPAMLRSHEQERRPITINSIERSGVHMRVHMEVAKLINGSVRQLDTDTEDAKALRKLVQAHYEKNDGENTDFGIEMGYRYKSDIIIPDESKEPPWTPSEYIPTTFPGSRAPHVFLRNGRSIIDEFGPYYTLIDFSTSQNSDAGLLTDAAWRTRVPLKHVRLPDEPNVHHVYERRFVLVRPDGHVAWRADEVADAATAEHVFETVRGDNMTTPAKEESAGMALTMDVSQTGDGAFAFTSTTGLDTQTGQFELEKMGGFQS